LHDVGWLNNHARRDAHTDSQAHVQAEHRHNTSQTGARQRMKQAWEERVQRTAAAFRRRSAHGVGA
jgi:hypothetical protein